MLHFAQQTAALLIRGFSLLVLGLVLAFPAYKGIWLAYAAVGAGLCAALILRRCITGEKTVMGSWSEKAFLWTALAGPALVQMALLLWLRPEPTFDGLCVFQDAQRLLETGRMPPLTYYPPAQAWWYGLWFRLFTDSPLAAQMSHVPLHALVTLLTYRVARFAVGKNARVAAMLVAWYPSFLAYPLTTPYYHFLYTAGVVATAWAWLDPMRALRSAWLGGLASGLGALTKATQLIAPGQALFFWVLQPSARVTSGGESDPVGAAAWARVVVPVALFVLGMAMVVGPWTMRNWVVFGDFVPVCTSGGLVLYSANHPDSNGLYSPLPDQVSIATPQEMLAHSRASSEQAKRYILEQPGRFLRLATIKTLHTWGGEATFAELINHRGRALRRLDDAFSAAFYFGWVTVATLWAMGSWRSVQNRAPLSALELAVGVAVGSNAAVYAVFEGGDRHHLPLVPLVILLGSCYSRRMT